MSACTHSIRRLAVTGAIVTTMFGLATPANAGFMMTWDASGDGEDPLYYDPGLFGTVEDLGNGVLRYVGGLTNQFWTIEWNVIVDPDPFVDAQIVVTNNADAFQEFSLLMALPIVPLGGPTSQTGSVSATVTNEFDFDDFATLRAVNGKSIYQAYIDDEFGVGTPAHELMNDPFSLVTTSDPFATASETQDFGPLVGGGINTFLSLRLQFELSPGDQASVNGVFEVIPGPGGLALLAVFGIASRGRRRRV